jgi:DNA-directed RNA polymerase specialized sigma24 family protein
METTSKYDGDFEESDEAVLIKTAADEDEAERAKKASDDGFVPRVRFWPAFRRRLDARLLLPLSSRLSETLAGTAAGLPVFEFGKALVAFQGVEGGEWEQKDAVLGVLVRTQFLFPDDAESFELLVAAMAPILWERFNERRGWAPWQFGVEEWFDELWMHLLAAWTGVLRAYPITRRPAKFAANLKGLLTHELARREKAQKRHVEAETWIKEMVVPMVEAESVPAVGDEPGVGVFGLSPSEEEETPFDADELAQQRARLAQAAPWLSAIDCAVVILFVRGGMRHKAIGNALGISEGTSRQRLKKSIETLNRFRGALVPIVRVEDVS